MQSAWLRQRRRCTLEAMADSLDFTIVYEPGEDGWILARVAELPSVLT